MARKRRFERIDEDTYLCIYKDIELRTTKEAVEDMLNYRGVNFFDISEKLIDRMISLKYLSSGDFARIVINLDVDPINETVGFNFQILKRLSD